jgi:hypothetical protein
VRPPAPAVKPNFNKGFEAARAKGAAHAADYLRTQGSALLSRTQRAAMLNQIAHQMLRRQQQAATLTELRQLRTDWNAVGPGAGLDPLMAMELEAAESAAERVLLAEALRLVRDGRFAEATAKLDALGSPRYLPAAVVQALPELRAELKRAVPFLQVQVGLKKQDAGFAEVWRPVVNVSHDRLAPAIVRAGGAWSTLELASAMLAGDMSVGRPVTRTVENIEQMLKDVKKTAGAELAGKLRVELSAKLFLDGRAGDAAKLLEGDVDPFHAAAVLADLRAVVLGRGEITTAQVAALVPADGASPPPQAAAVLPPDQLGKWKPPARKPGESIIDLAIADARTKLKAAVDAEVADATGRVNAAADRVRAALAAEAGPRKAFLDKVEAARGRAFATPAERQLAVVAGTRGLTVAETVGVLAADADRPAAVARLALAVPTFTSPAAFAAAVELSGRAPAAFAPHPDAGFKLTAVRDRARVRDAYTAILDLHASRLANNRPVPPMERGGLEAEVAKRLGLPAADPLTPAECVQALLDVGRDWADDHARLSAAWHELNDAISDAEDGLTTTNYAELKPLLTAAKVRRSATLLDRKRREVGLVVACRLLGEYGPAGVAAAPWLREQAQGGKPWTALAAEALAKVAK